MIGASSGKQETSADQERRDGRETWHVGPASNMQKAQADGTPDRAVRKELLMRAIKKGTQGTANNHNGNLPTAIGVTVSVINS